jgi:hypothetical protein
MDSRGRFAKPTDFAGHYCSPYSHVHVRRESLGFVHRSRAISRRPRAKLSGRFAPFQSLYGVLSATPAACLHRFLALGSQAGMLSFDEPKLQTNLSYFVMQPFFEAPQPRPRRADLIHKTVQTQTDITDRFSREKDHLHLQYQTPGKKRPPG